MKASISHGNITISYPLADSPTVAELQRLGVNGKIHKSQLAAVRTGAMRPPKRGEWYLSGAIVEAYKALNDLSTPYHIARLITND